MLDREAPWLLLPVKSLQRGKMRLAPILSQFERRSLNEFFLRRTINIAAEFPGVQRTAVISEADDTLTLAKELGVHTIRQTDGHGLNNAATQGSEELCALGVRKLLILPIDLPLLQTRDLYEVTALERQHNVVICPDKHHAGTNAIFALCLHFFDSHLATKATCGINKKFNAAALFLAFITIRGLRKT